VRKDLQLKEERIGLGLGEGGSGATGAPRRTQPVPREHVANTVGTCEHSTSRHHLLHRSSSHIAEKELRLCDGASRHAVLSSHASAGAQSARRRSLVCSHHPRPAALALRSEGVVTVPLLGAEAELRPGVRRPPAGPLSLGPPRPSAGAGGGGQWT